MNIALIVKNIVLAGTEGCEREENKKVIKIINALSFVTALAASLIGTLIYFYTRSLEIEIPAMCEAALFSSVILWNKYKRYNTANLFFILTHTVSALYFGIILGQLINITLVAVFIFGLSFLILRSKKLLAIAIAAIGLTLILLEVNFYYQIFQPLQLSRQNQFILRWLALFVLLGFDVFGVLLTIYYMKENRSLYLSVKEYSEKLEATVKDLEFANLSKRVYLRETSHEIRTPLNAVFGISQLLEMIIKRAADKDEKISSTDFKEMTDLVISLNAASYHARNVVNNVLELSTIEAGKLNEINKVVFHLKPWIESVVQIHGYIAQSKEVKLILNIDESAKRAALISDKVKLTQIISNLLSNAIKFSPEKAAVNLQVFTGGTSLYIKVSNSGEGISEEKQMAIFEPFVTGKNGFTEGTGLGLYITKFLIELLSGTITLKTAQGKGTTFEICFPNVFAEPSTIQHSDTSNTQLCNLNDKKILMIDDDKMARTLISRYLTNAGSHFIQAENGIEGIERAREEKPDIIILDSHMPGMSGKETLLHIRHDQSLQNIPVILASGDAYKESREELLNAGANDFLTKPIKFTELHKAISQFIC